jgi:cytidylate kinase
MSHAIGFHACHSFIRSQLESPPAKKPDVRPVITISRMAGAGGHRVAADLADYLQAHADTGFPWTVFDRNLIEQVLADHELSREIGDFMPEGHKSSVADYLEELLGLHPSTWTLVHQTCETLLHLARMGSVILVGRAASVVARGLPNSFHVRLAGSPERRVKRLAQLEHLDEKAAVRRMHQLDRGRRRYLKDHFGEDIDDPLLYHVTINTDRISCAETARLIGEEVIHRFNLRPKGARVSNPHP